jgi:PEP-CTERM motif
MGSRTFRSALLGGSFLAAMAMASPALAIPITTTFNFVPTTVLTANTGNVTTATSITSGAPDIVTSILTDNTGLTSLTSIIGLETPTPTTLGAVFTKTFTTLLGVFTETLTVTSRSVGARSLGILAEGTIVETTVLSGAALDPAPVFYSAAYTQNDGPGSQINASFNDDSTSPPFLTPEPASLLLLGGGLAGLVATRLRSRRKA